MNRRKLIRTRVSQPSRKTSGKSTLFWVVAGLLLAASVFTAIQTATAGAELSSLQKKEVSLQEDKRILSHNLASSTSLFDSETKAESLGFAKASQIIYLTDDTGVAKLP